MEIIMKNLFKSFSLLLFPLAVVQSTQAEIVSCIKLKKPGATVVLLGQADVQSNVKSAHELFISKLEDEFYENYITLHPAPITPSSGVGQRLLSLDEIVLAAMERAEEVDFDDSDREISKFFGLTTDNLIKKYEALKHIIKAMPLENKIDLYIRNILESSWKVVRQLSEDQLIGVSSEKNIRALMENNYKKALEAKILLDIRPRDLPRYIKVLKAHNRLEDCLFGLQKPTLLNHEIGILANILQEQWANFPIICCVHDDHVGGLTNLFGNLDYTIAEHVGNGEDLVSLDAVRSLLQGKTKGKKPYDSEEEVQQTTSSTTSVSSIRAKRNGGGIKYTSRNSSRKHPKKSNN